jgi:citrate lyase subunit beta / citryl-CoA lyase
MVSIDFLRSWLFVPGHDKRKIAGAAASQADVVVLDWEDAVLPDQKAMARDCSSEIQMLRDTEKRILVRVNSYHSDWHRDDLKSASSLRLDGLVLPKCESAEEISDVVEFLQKEAGDWDFGLCAMIESPRGLLRVEAIATASDRVWALAFGAQDFSWTTGIHASPEETELLMAKSQIVNLAKAYGLAAVDSPVIALDDLAAVREAARRSYRLGFTGKFAIHPKHVPAIAEAFAPSSKEAEEAEEILRQANILKLGAFAWKGQMIDKAVLERARLTVRRFQAHLEMRS